MERSEKEDIEMISEIAKKIVAIGLDSQLLAQTPDAEVNQHKYQGQIVPLIESFRERTGVTPNSYLKKILEIFYSDQGLSDEFDCKGFHFYGHKVNPYTWAVITRKDPSIKNFKISYYPQLYVSVNGARIIFGYAYGDRLKNTEKSVTIVTQRQEIRDLISSILENNKKVHVHAYSKEATESPGDQDDDITDHLIGGDYSGWTSEISLIEEISSTQIPEDINSHINNTLKALLPLFLVTSFPDDTERIDKILQNYYSELPTRLRPHVWADVKERLVYSFVLPENAFPSLYFSDKEARRLHAEILGALRSGKHIILTGPPGTGKSKIAQAICDAIAKAGNYHMCTASPDWSVYETIGGYRPKQDNTLEFHPGPFLRSFRVGNDPANSWLIVDEINRADIDKAFGSLFSALAGDDVVLPFEIDNEPVYLIGNPRDTTPIKACNFIVHPDWRIIATMNTYDKSSLYEMSYAFMRRFAFIMVDSPGDVDAEAVGKYVDAWGFERDPQRCQNVADLWSLVNRHRKIGPALFHDIYQFVVEVDDMDPRDDEMDSAIALFLFPQFEGLPEEQQKKFVDELVSLPFIADPIGLRSRAATFFHIPPWGSA